MKPLSPVSRSDRRCFPRTDCFLQSDMGSWRGGFSFGRDDDSPAHRFNQLSREFRLESMRERRREMVVFALVMVVAAWPVIYMIVSVIELLVKERTLR
ncbi:MAG: hypothetical protein ABI839_01810 [Verrucomicrobiota bacterium]